MASEIQGAQSTRQALGVRTGALKSIQVTLSTAGTVTTITIPNEAIGFRLYPATAVRFAAGEDPAVIATSSDTTIATSALAVGGIARANEWAVRYLSGGSGRSLRLIGAAGAEVVDVEFF